MYIDMSSSEKSWRGLVVYFRYVQHALMHSLWWQMDTKVIQNK